MNHVTTPNLRPEQTVKVQAAAGVRRERRGSNSVMTTCPLCRGDTGIERQLDPELGPLSLDEFETLVRNEWRRRLGSRSYTREHSRTIIRALLVYALGPESPVRSTVIKQLIWWKLTTLGAAGLTAAAVRHEFHELTLAVRHVLNDAGVPSERTARLIDAIEAKLRNTLDGRETAP